MSQDGLTLVLVDYDFSSDFHTQEGALIPPHCDLGFVFVFKGLYTFRGMMVPWME